MVKLFFLKIIYNSEYLYNFDLFRINTVVNGVLLLLIQREVQILRGQDNIEILIKNIYYNYLFNNFKNIP